jgi:hypothetical protein
MVPQGKKSIASMYFEFLEFLVKKIGITRTKFREQKLISVKKETKLPPSTVLKEKTYLVRDCSKVVRDRLRCCGGTGSTVRGTELSADSN